MKIKTISRTEEDYVRKSKLDIVKVHRNRDPVVHPFERAREYARAVVATKLDKIFAKPFVGALGGHKDGVYCMSSVRSHLVPFISGSCDGEVRVWDLSTKHCVWHTIAHEGFVRGVAPDVAGNAFYSCGDDKVIKLWALQHQSEQDGEVTPLNVIYSAHAMTSIDHHWVDSQFATSGDVVSVWDGTRAQPINTYKWGADSVLCVRYNPAEACLLASTGNDRSVCLYDLRSSLPMRKMVMAMNANKVAWNPREPMNFTLASEDYNLYTFDMRKLDHALMIHKDHVGAVMDVAYSPTGREFVSASYDRTVRIFNVTSGKSREAYHTKRMQRVFCSAFSADAEYVLSGSDDTNVRIWRAVASKSGAVDAGRAERKKQYMQSLKKRFAHMPEIKRMNSDKKLPKAIRKAKGIMHVQRLSQHRKTENRIKHSREGSIVLETERKKAVIKELE